MNTEGIAGLVAGGVELRTGDKVSIFATDVSVVDLVSTFVELCYRQGAWPQVVWTDERFDLSALQYASVGLLQQPPPVEALAMEWSDVHVSFRGMAPPSAVAPDAGRAAALRKGRGVISTMRWQGTRWALVRVPTPAWAARFGLDFDDWQTEWASSFDLDWSQAGVLMQTLCDRLDECNEVVIKDVDTELHLPVAGRKWRVNAGRSNWPDGEIMTAPLESSISGHIAFPGMIAFGSMVVKDLELVFEQGRVTSFNASDGREFVEHILDTDPGARFVGELGIGTNPRLATMTHDLLLDEKIMGTAHIALGRAYPECGGVNQSAIHWDIVKDLRGPYGSLVVDDLTLIGGGTPLGSLLEACG